MTYIPGLVPNGGRKPAQHIPAPTYYGGRYAEVKYRSSKGRETPEPPEDPDALPNRVASVFGGLAAQQLIDGNGGAAEGYRNRLAHLRAREEYMSTKVDLGEPAEDWAYCYTGGGDVHVYKRHPFEDTWELDRMYREGG